MKIVSCTCLLFSTGDSAGDWWSAHRRQRKAGR